MYPVTVFIERFRASVSVLIGPCCPALLESYSCKCAYSCRPYYWSNKMMMMMILKVTHSRRRCGLLAAVTVAIWLFPLLDNPSAAARAAAVTDDLMMMNIDLYLGIYDVHRRWIRSSGWRRLRRSWSTVSPSGTPCRQTSDLASAVPPARRREPRPSVDRAARQQGK